MFGAGPDAVMLAIATHGHAPLHLPPRVPQPGKAHPGDACATDKDCASGFCESKACVEKTTGSLPPKYQNVMLLPSEAMSKGQLESGWQFCDLKAGKYALDSDATHLEPVTRHGSTTDRRNYAVVPVNDGHTLAVMAFDHLFTNQQSVTSGSVAINTLETPRAAPQGNGVALMVNVNQDLIAAAYNGGRLFTTAMELDPANKVDVVRVIGIDMKNFPNLAQKDLFLDSTLGNGTDDATWPGLEVNDNGDAVVAFTVSGPKTFPSIETMKYQPPWFGVPRLLKAGQAWVVKDGTRPTIGASTRWVDTVGAALDASDGTAVWIADTYGNAKGGSSVFVAKVR
jgi:hypothetical protein